MDDITNSVQAKQARSQLKRVITFLKDPDLIASMRKRLDNAVALFQVCSHEL